MITFRTAAGHEELRVVDGKVESRERPSHGRDARWSEWKARSKRSLLEYAVDSPVWAWLKAQGVKRPAPSGKSGRNPPRADRGHLVEVKLSKAAAAALERLVVRYGSKSEAVEAAVLALDGSVLRR
jgi:hypothetical protein